MGATRLHIGIGVDQNLPWTTLVERWRLIEALGFDSIWDFAHLNQPSRPGGPYQAWSVLAGLAVHTRRVRIGVLVSCNTLRHPSLLAKQAVTLEAHERRPARAARRLATKVDMSAAAVTRRLRTQSAPRDACLAWGRRPRTS